MQQRLQRYAQVQPAEAAARGGHVVAVAAVELPSRVAVASTTTGIGSAGGDSYASASAEIADIDSRLQSLQSFLRAAKAGQPAAVPA